MKKQISISRYKTNDRDVIVVNWPGTDDQVGICILNCHEMQQAHFAARQTFKKANLSINPASQGEFEFEEENQECFRMLIDPEAKTNSTEFRVFSNVDECRKKLDSYERKYFIQKHYEFLNNKAKNNAK